MAGSPISMDNGTRAPDWFSTSAQGARRATNYERNTGLMPAAEKLRCAPVFKKTLKLLTGIGLVILGIIGIILPVMPGWIFMIPGLIILGEFFPPIQRLVDWAKQKAASEFGASGGKKDPPA